MARFRAALLSISLALVPAAATAQEHGPESTAEAAGPSEAEHGAEHVSVLDVFRSVEFWGSVVNFALLVALVTYLGRKPLRQYLRDRRLAVEEGLADARRLKIAAEAKYAEYSGRLEQLDREMAQIRAEMVKAGEAERDRIVAEAEGKAARMRRDVQFLIDQQMKQLRVDVVTEAVEAAVGAAEEALRGSATAADQDRLAARYLEGIEGTARETGEGT